MCFGGGTRVVEKPMPQQQPAPTATKAALGEEAGVKLAKKERKAKEQSALAGMKISLNTGGTKGGTPGATTTP
tara:strand:- start:5431 stop:5649 length:219 start_codon:yes stop_codon:yes gene_type:complete